MTGNPRYDAGLGPYNERKRALELEAVRNAIAVANSTGSRISFHSIAKASGVSRSTLYRNQELRAMVEKARETQCDPNSVITRLREENAKLKLKLSMARGHVGRSRREYSAVAF